MKSTRDTKTVLLTGGTGYIGGLIMAKLLVEEPDVSFLVLVRRPVDIAELLRPVEAEMRLNGHRILPQHQERLRLVTLPDWRQPSQLQTLVRKLGVEAVLHAAGGLDYFHAEALHDVNVN